MDKSEIKRIVAEQVCNMIDNNIVCGYGNESFIGWLEDGDIFFNAETPFSEQEVSEIMDFVRGISDLVDDLSWKLAPEVED